MKRFQKIAAVKFTKILGLKRILLEYSNDDEN